MQELIKIEKRVIGTEELNSVDARDLHKALNIQKPFADWIKVQIERAGLQLNVDYIIQTTQVDREVGASSRKDYIVSADSAKHIAMMSQGTKAKAVRDYFIAVEKEYKAGTIPNSAPQILSILENMSKIMLVQSETISQLQSTIATLDEHVKMFAQDASGGLYAVSEALYLKNLEDTLSTDMLDEIKANVKDKAQTLARKYCVAEAEVTKLIFANINNNFGVKTYYKIQYSDFLEVKRFIKHIDLSGHKVVVSL